MGTSFDMPAFIIGIQGTFSLTAYTYFGAGFDLGFVAKEPPYEDSFTDTSYSIDSYSSLYPYINFGTFIPFKNKGGWFFELGYGHIFSNFVFSDQWRFTED